MYVGLRQLRRKQFCTQLLKAYTVEKSYDQLLIDTAYCHAIAHKQFTYIEEYSNEPLCHIG